MANHISFNYMPLANCHIIFFLRRLGLVGYQQSRSQFLRPSRRDLLQIFESTGSAVSHEAELMPVYLQILYLCLNALRSLLPDPTSDTRRRTRRLGSTRVEQEQKAFVRTGTSNSRSKLNSDPTSRLTTAIITASSAAGQNSANLSPGTDQLGNQPFKIQGILILSRCAVSHSNHS
ncbi:hypothetical protein DFH06DRAFT_1341942 [Mycena polygramma]|nr:hypothetical protein DFH06DRAFT_1341942 [Mycena polygramma]